MLRAALRLIVPLAFVAAAGWAPAKAQYIGFGWGGYAFPQYGYGYGCPPVYYLPYCASFSYGYPFTMPYFYWGGYSPYRFGYYGYGHSAYYGSGLRYPMYRAGSPGYRGYGGYRPGYPGYRGTRGAGYGQFSPGATRFGGGFAGGGFRGGGFHGGGRR